MTDTRQAARLRLAGLRVGSAVLAAVLVGVVLVTGGAFALAVLGLLAAVAVLVGPGAPLVSLLTVWSGYRITSCPHCPQVGVDRVGIQHATCAVCGTEEYQIGSTMNGWIHHVSAEAWTCSSACRSAFNAEEGHDA